MQINERTIKLYDLTGLEEEDLVNLRIALHQALVDNVIFGPKAIALAEKVGVDMLSVADHEDVESDEAGGEAVARDERREARRKPRSTPANATGIPLPEDPRRFEEKSMFHRSH